MRPALETRGSIGIFTDFPSTMAIALILGTGSPAADCLYRGNLGLSADGNLTRLFATRACILSSAPSSNSHKFAFMGLQNAPLPSTLL